MKKAIVLAGSRGIGKGIADSLEQLDLNVIRTSSKDLDTSNLNDVDNFIKNNSYVDVLVLNTGGPPSQEFKDITEEDCIKYHNQLFYSFFKILQRLYINDGGYIFLVSSFNVKEPNGKLLLSNAYRTAFISVLKCLSKEFAKRNITTINVAPGPIDTFVKSIIENNIKYLNGVTINFDGGHSNYLF